MAVAPALPLSDDNSSGHLQGAAATADLALVWEAKGKKAMEWTADNQPAVFFATCARLIGPEVELTIEQSLPGNLPPADWADLRELLSAIQTALPDVADRSPGEVFRYALPGLRNCPEISGQLPTRWTQIIGLLAIPIVRAKHRKLDNQ